jgi:hypothetical protein
MHLGTFTPHGSSTGLRRAVSGFAKGLAIADHLAKADPSNAGLQGDLAASHHKVAMVLAQQGDAIRSLEQLRLARAIIERLKQQLPDNVQFANALAVLNGEIKKLDQADGSEPGTVQPEQAAQ